MRVSGLFIIVLSATLGFSVLHAPQPLLGVFAREFSISTSQAALLTTVTLLPLAIGPIMYGYLLELFSARQLLMLSTAGLAVFTVSFASSPSYGWLVATRVMQGVMIPAMFTSMMTYVSHMSDPDRLSTAMSRYIAATIFGAFIGRIFAGAVSASLGFRAVFLFLGIGLFAVAAAQYFLAPDRRAGIERPPLKTVYEVLMRPATLRVYAVAFCVYLVFYGVLNFLPFRMDDITGSTSELRVALMYSGYVIGIIISLNTPRIITWFGSEDRTMTVGLVLYIVSLFLLNTPSTLVIFFAMFVFSAGMFLVHTTAAASVNRLAGDTKGVGNGLYVSFYYGGGAVGSLLPGFIFAAAGWQALTFALVQVCIIALVIIGFSRLAFKAGEDS